MEGKLQRCAEALRRHGFEARVADNAPQALGLLQAAVAADRPKRSQRSAHRRISSRSGRGIEPSSSVKRSSLRSHSTKPVACRVIGSPNDTTGINAVTEQGALHWLDRVGNRIAPMAFGPRKVLLVAERNKIAADRPEAEERIRRIAAPLNVARHPGFRTPCARTGVRAGCNSPDRICNTRMEMLRCHPAGRILIVLIDEDLGL